MKDKILQWLKFRYKDIIVIVVIFLVTLGLLIHFFDLQKADFSIPFSYVGDGMSVLIETKMTAETGWNTGTELLGAPGEFDNASSLISGMHNADVLTSKIFLMISGNNVPFAVNMTYLATFFIIAYVSYLVLRTLKLKEWISAAGSLTYAFLAFVFCRGVGHLVLSCYYFIPLLVLICLWIYEDSRFLLINKEFFKYKKNIAAIVMFFCIANSGIMYWQFFGCFFLCVTMFSCLVKTKDFNYLKKGFLGIAFILVFMVIGAFPEFLSILSGNSGIEGRYRSIVDSEIYCLKIIQLILPLRGHGIVSLQNLINSYNESVPSVTENYTAYLGIVGIIGFMILLVALFTRKKDTDSVAFKRIAALSELNICAVLFATMGGFGTAFFIFISPTLRSYNRISVYIAFFAIATVCILVDVWYKKLQKPVFKILLAVAVSIFMLLGIFEQNPKNGIDYIGNRNYWESDSNYVSNIESQVAEGSMIFELPYHDYPEGGPVNEMMDYEQFMGYVHSDTLRWSYGIMVNSELDTWYNETANLVDPALKQMDIAKFISALKEKGFAGIAIDRNAYIQLDDAGNRLLRGMGEIAPNSVNIKNVSERMKKVKKLGVYTKFYDPETNAWNNVGYEIVNETYSELEKAISKYLGTDIQESDNRKWSFIKLN